MVMTTTMHSNPFVIAFRDSAAWAANKTWTCPAACRVIDAWLVLRGTAAGTLQLKGGAAGADAITAAVTLATSDKDIQSMASLDDAYVDLAAGEVLTAVPGSSPIGDMFVLLVWL